MIENLIRALIASLDANTAAHGGAVPADSTGAGEAAAPAAAETKTASTTKPAGKGKGAAAAPKGPKREEVVALLTKIKDDHGTTDAKKVLAGVCGDEVKMAQIPDESLKAVFDAATEFLAKAAGSGDDDDDNL